MAATRNSARGARTRSRRRRSTRASRADRYELYQRSVQEPEYDVSLIQRVFRNHYGRPARILREDFCGTAHMACTWVEAHRENRAFGIDLDPEPLDWGRRHNVAKLSPEAQTRLELIKGDVRDLGFERADVTLAFNFSYFVFRERAELLGYFRRARAGILPEGIFFLDAYGGADSFRTGPETRKLEGFDYVWDQARVEPISHSVRNYIHFRFPDGSQLRRAFRYEWRLWTLPEIRDCLLDAGFRDVEFYWEGTDSKTGDGNGSFTRRREAEDDPAWVAYIAAIP
jgi:hypothetical protein